MLTNKLADEANRGRSLLSRETRLIQSLQQKGQIEAASEIMSFVEQIQDNAKKISRYKSYIDKFRQINEIRLYKTLLKMYREAKELVRLIGRIAYKGVVIGLSIVIRYISNGEIWLIGERSDQAEDNGFEFFKYCREQYPKKNIFYVIDCGSKDTTKVKNYGNVIYHSTFKHHIYVLAADKYISAWTFKESLLPRNYGKLLGNTERLKKKKNICLQHGVIIHNISPYLHKDIYAIDYLICSSAKEKEIIKNTLGYSDKEILVTGLARFDNLIKANPKRQILVMPTWRRHLANKSKEVFEGSTFFQTYRRLLINQRLIELLHQCDYELVFYLHHNFQEFNSSFKFTSGNITVVDCTMASAASLIQTSSILITDYSSVASDFVYMNRPVLFYQFDPYHNHHSTIEEIKYRDLGAVVETEERLIQQLDKLMMGINHGELQKCKDVLFDRMDVNHCTKIFESIANV